MTGEFLLFRGRIATWIRNEVERLLIRAPQVIDEFWNFFSVENQQLVAHRLVLLDANLAGLADVNFGAVSWFNSAHNI